jgi:4-diphosphocytidyl-2C-methyl-D-erythritol kinase
MQAPTWCGRATTVADACVNDLEAPAFAVMPDLAQLKARLAAEGRFDAVFMTGARCGPAACLWRMLMFLCSAAAVQDESQHMTGAHQRGVL